LETSLAYGMTVSQINFTLLGIMNF